MTTIIKLSTKPIKTRRKSGHTQRTAEYNAWLDKLGVKNKQETPFRPLTSVPKVIRRPDHRELPSVEIYGGSATKKNAPKYEGELAEREKKAQQEIAYKKTCVAPYCNKGGYVYVTPGMDPTTLGRKV
jgi:hypothetical protein